MSICARAKRRERGIVSAYVVLVLSVLITVSLGVASLGTQSLRRIRHDRDSMIAEQAAFAALDQMTGKEYQNLTTGGTLTAMSTDLSSDLNGVAPGCVATGWVTPSSSNYAYVTATVTYKTITRSARSYFQQKNVGMWNNAIFAGAGAAGQAINGNASIAGSLHILGDGEPYLDLYGTGVYFAGDPYTDKNKNGHWDAGEPFTDLRGTGVYAPPDPFNDVNANGVYDPPDTQTTLDATLSGTAQIINNYVGLSSSLSPLIPPIPTVGGVKTLSSEVRVKHGEVSLSGAASVGQSGVVDSGLSKGTVDGTYVSDGWTGNKGASSVSSDNGTTNTYDLGNLGLVYPIITGVGAPTYVDKNGTSWTTQQTYLDSNSLTVPITTITSSTANFTYGPDAKGDSISWTKGSPGVLNINGIVKIAGNLQIGAKDSLSYKGSGTIYSTGSVNIDGDLLPQSGLVFPTTTRLGVIAVNNINIATGNGSSHISMAGAFYAQGSIVEAKQTDVMGTFLASYFDMGKNVPNIWQVPALPTHMPPGMPGDKNYISLTVATVRDRSPLPGTSDTFSGGTPYTGG